MMNRTEHLLSILAEEVPIKRDFKEYSLLLADVALTALQPAPSIIGPLSSDTELARAVYLECKAGATCKEWDSDEFCRGAWLRVIDTTVDFLSCRVQPVPLSGDAELIVRALEYKSTERLCHAEKLIGLDEELRLLAISESTEYASVADRFRASQAAQAELVRVVEDSCNSVDAFLDSGDLSPHWAEHDRYWLRGFLGPITAKLRAAIKDCSGPPIEPTPKG